MFLSNRLHCYALSLAFHWWLVKWTCHYELLRTRSKSFKAKYYHCSVHTACTKINRSQQKFSILIHYFQADTFIPYGEHGWHDKYQMFEILVFTPVLQVWLLSYPGNMPQNKQTKQKSWDTVFLPTRAARKSTKLLNGAVLFNICFAQGLTGLSNNFTTMSLSAHVPLKSKESLPQEFVTTAEEVATQYKAE